MWSESLAVENAPEDATPGARIVETSREARVQ